MSDNASNNPNYNPNNPNNPNNGETDGNNTNNNGSNNNGWNNNNMNNNNNPNNNNSNANNNNSNNSNNDNSNTNTNTNNTNNPNEPIYLVVRNAEEQYSIWPAGREVPAGWETDGIEGPKDVCLEHITQVWTDMRPLSLRRRMELSHA